MTGPDELTEPDRRALRIEIVVVLAVTFGLSAYTAILELVEAILLNLSAQIVALNPRLSPFDLINLGLHLARVAQLVAWGALGVYLLWRSGFGPAGSGWAASAGVPMCSAASASPRWSACPDSACMWRRAHWA